MPAGSNARGDYDVAVIGAGPAGSATARWLSQRGLRVALIERTRFDAPRIGESFAPGVQEPLRQLGLWGDFLALAPLPSWGTRSLWGNPEPQSHSHLVNPYGCGWHVDRRAFDRMMAEGAARAGVDLLEGVELRQSTWNGGLWHLRVTSTAPRAEAAPRFLEARVLVDATGRRAQVGRSLGAQRMPFDRLVGVAAYWAGVDEVEQGHLLVEAAQDGWWYSASLPGAPPGGKGAMVAMLMTDADLCAAQHLATVEGWQACLADATRQRLGSARRVSAPKVHCARSHRLLHEDGLRPSGPWLAVGDAALAVDPISGSGVLRALRTARAGADTLCEMLDRPHVAQELLAAYKTERDGECTAYLVERAQYYEAEQRFDTPFWQRRHLLRRVAPDTRPSRPSATPAV